MRRASACGVNERGAPPQQWQRRPTKRTARTRHTLSAKACTQDSHVRTPIELLAYTARGLGLLNRAPYSGAYVTAATSVAAANRLRETRRRRMSAKRTAVEDQTGASQRTFRIRQSKQASRRTQSTTSWRKTGNRKQRLEIALRLYRFVASDCDSSALYRKKSCSHEQKGTRVSQPTADGRAEWLGPKPGELHEDAESQHRGKHSRDDTSMK